MSIRRHSALLFCVALAACTIDGADDTDDTDDTDSGDAAGAEDNRLVDGFVLGAACTDGAACGIGSCTIVGDRGFCLQPCTDDADCAVGWTCATVASLDESVCRCAPTGTERPNGEDDDCDGLVDEGFARVAFWNIRDLSLTSRDDTELSLIADVLEDFDLVTVAELNDEHVLESIEALLDARGAPWESKVSAPVGNSPQSAESYGVIWRADRFAVDALEQLPEVETSAGTRFDREPVVARVRVVGGGADLALIVVHVHWTDVDARIAEVHALEEYVGLVRESERDVLVTGDLNRNVGDLEALEPLLAATGLMDTSDASEPTVVGSDNTYDHILLDPAATREFTGDRGVDAFDAFLFPDDPDGASLAVSDHRPVWIAIDTSVADDD